MQPVQHRRRSLRLRFTYPAFWRLVRARSDLVKPQRKGGSSYRLADIQAISEKYVFVGEIALRRELHPRLAVAWLKLIGVKPAFSVREKQDLVYLRSELEPLLGRQREGSMSPPKQAALREITTFHHQHNDP